MKISPRMEEEADIIFELIKDNCNTYFRVKHIIDEALKIFLKISMKDIIDSYKCDKDPYGEERKIIRHIVTCTVQKLKKENKIEKYSRTYWKIIK